MKIFKGFVKDYYMGYFIHCIYIYLNLQFRVSYNRSLLFSLQLSLKSRSVEVAPGVFQAYNAILHS